ncbi:hypothetical protein OESDEN_05249 [Oesophagostomum dentatum]|uniref:Uncharacterized protein n=1 Tax=Oesophagostomum dentatum TaxID=61180 RepID=A0A0B1TB78_OESDE|nr:hypothetical protein OESDEN_05249 [Oesophagostomum dentatum]
MMLSERIVATFRKSSYEDAGPHIGLLLLSVGVAISIGLTLWSILEENFSNSYPYCSSWSNVTIERLYKIHYFLCGVCAASLIGILGLRAYNKFAVERRTYSLGDSFHWRENQFVVQLLCPLAVFQAIFLLLFVAGGLVVASYRRDLNLITFRTVFAGFYFIPFYTMFTPVIILAIVRKAKRASMRKLESMRNVTNERDIYFTSYYKVWNKL